MSKRRVIVLFGGRSAEHEVSCASAVNVLHSIDPIRYDVLPIGITRDGRWVRAEGAAALLGAAGMQELPCRVEAVGAHVVPTDVLDATVELPPVVIPLLHGPFGEDGTMQGMLETAGVPYVGAGVLGSAVAMDKGVAKDLLARAGLPQAAWLTRAAWDLANATEVMSFRVVVERELGFPCFVKPANLGSSVGVSKVRTREEFAAAVALALSYDEWVVVEEAILGREIEFAVLGNERPEVSIAGEIRPGHDFYDYEDKYAGGGAELLIPADLTPAQLAEGQRLAIAAFRALRCDGMARVDFFFDDGSTGGTNRGWLINEANTIPGFTPTSMYPKLWAASGLSYPELLDRLIELAVARHERRAGRIGRGRGA
jgi:D-alanine-D-alanine ligase